MKTVLRAKATILFLCSENSGRKKTVNPDPTGPETVNIDSAKIQNFIPSASPVSSPWTTCTYNWITDPAGFINIQSGYYTQLSFIDSTEITFILINSTVFRSFTLSCPGTPTSAVPCTGLTKPSYGHLFFRDSAISQNNW